MIQALQPAVIFPPGVILICGGLLLPLLPRTWRSAAAMLAPLIALTCVWLVPEDARLTLDIASFSLEPLHIHPFSRIFATAFCLAAFAGIWFGLPVLKKSAAGTAEFSAALVYAGGAAGVTFAGDFITFFLFWEVMAVASAIVILCGGTAVARKAALRYALMHVTGGALLLAGIAARGAGALQPLQIHWPLAGLEDASSLLILLGILVNAAAPPFSAWLPDAYPEASPSGAVFLSAFTTKTAVFVLITLFAGTQPLIWIGMFMIFYGIIYAMLENDFRRILAYSIVNQVGFMVTGAGIGTELALAGAAAHAFCHILYKALLMMSAGSVLYVTGKRRCTDVGGLWRSMPVTMLCALTGAAAISAVPWTSGFVSKPLISAAAANEHLAAVWFLLLAASAGVFLHAGIKFPWFVFFHRDAGLKAHDPPLPMRGAMIFTAALCILLGVFPRYLYEMLPAMPNYVLYTPEHIITQTQLLIFAALPFFLMLRWLERTDTASLDLDRLYRAPLAMLLRGWWVLTDKASAPASLMLQRGMEPEAAVRRLSTLGWPPGRPSPLGRAAFLLVLCLSAAMAVFLFT